MGERIPKSLSIMLLLLLPVVLVTGWSLWSLLQATPTRETTATVDREVTGQPIARPTALSPRPAFPGDTPSGGDAPGSSAPGNEQDAPTSAPERVSQATPYTLSPVHGLQASCPATAQAPLSHLPAPAPRPLHASVPAESPTPTAGPRAVPPPESPPRSNQSASHRATPPPVPEPATPEAWVAGQRALGDNGAAEERHEEEKEPQEERQGRHRRGSENPEEDREPDGEEYREGDRTDPEGDD